MKKQRKILQSASKLRDRGIQDIKDDEGLLGPNGGNSLDLGNTKGLSFI
jgi:hypothetical protein